MTDTAVRQPQVLPQRRLWLGLCLVNTAVFLGFLLSFELLYGRWGQTYFPPRSAIVDRSFTYRQELYAPFGDIHYSRDKYGLRNPHGPIGSLRVMTVGGSTTDQHYISDGSTWQDVLQANTGIEIGNAGVDGITSRGHIVAVDEWLHRIPGLHPRIYLHYIGINDAEMVWHPTSVARYDVSGSDADWSVQIHKRSALFRAVRQLTARPVTAGIVGHGAIKIASTSSLKRADGEFDNVRRYIEQQYVRNIHTLINMHAVRNERVILASQPINPGLVQLRSEGVFVSPEPGVERLGLSLAPMNAATRTVCQARADICSFADVASSQFESADFYDAVHMTPRGAARLGRMLTSYLAR